MMEHKVKRGIQNTRPWIRKADQIGSRQILIIQQY